MKLVAAALTLLALCLPKALLAQHQMLGRNQCRTDHGNSGEVDGNTNRLLGKEIYRPAPPQTIKVGKDIYTVEVVKDVPATGEYAASFSGKICDKKAREESVCDVQDHIYIEAGHTLKEEQTTLLHELQHAILGTEMSDRKTTYHRFIYKLSPKLLEVLQENPDLYVYLTAAESKQK